MAANANILAYATSHEPLLNRAFRAYYRAGHREGLTDSQITIPANDSYVCLHNGRRYVILRNINGILAVYRVRSNDRLHGLERWPAEIAES